MRNAEVGVRNALGAHASCVAWGRSQMRSAERGTPWERTHPAWPGEGSNAECGTRNALAAHASCVAWGRLECGVRNDSNSELGTRNSELRMRNWGARREEVDYGRRITQKAFAG
jgi:hypothetical protein